ncbi:Nonsense-mediated decay protein 4 [Nakaseomyces bracarensis]|uniref:Nonsense-mediated decay protein 4 n=1 Tax=Nakaseomyces bracarensis TaxID=273131 RepID=A0ABR4NV40_9SACH
MSQYNFILDASAFEKGLGNVKRWCQVPKQGSKDSVHLRFYVPTFTLQELNFLQGRHKSFPAKEALKFIDKLETLTSDNQSNHTVIGRKVDDDIRTDLELFIEFPDILDAVSWSTVLDQVTEGPSVVDSLNKLPKRFKLLLKSCVFKCHLENDDGLRWILLTEDPQVRKIATQCHIPWVSIVDADSVISRDMNDRSFRNSEKFNNTMLKRGVTKGEDLNGREVVKTSFDQTVYASRGSGKLWTP